MHRLRFPLEMSEYFDLRWENDRIWALDLPIHTGSVDSFEWQLDLPFLPSNSPNQIFDLNPREIIENPTRYREQHQHFLNVVTHFPIETMYFGKLLVILDGFNRLMNHVVNERESITYRIVPNEMFSTIRAGSA